MKHPSESAAPVTAPPQELLEGEAAKGRLSQWYATAICGNDITSSCLYVAAIATVYAQALAPLALLIVAGILYLYRKIYTEVVEALPLNGGAYNCLLNSTRKFSAALAACLTLLSYLATAVISAKTAAEYISSLMPSVPAMEVTVLILAIFAGLTIIGITESSRVALAIFIFHLTSLTLILGVGVTYLLSHSGAWAQNWQFLRHEVHWPTALFFGVSASLLGVSGFESSANFVEQQQPGVFRLTLRNMWVAVLIFNPLISLMALSLLPIPEIVDHRDHLLSFIGLLTGGKPLHTLVVIEAGLVLSGAVLTSFIGVTGLVHRMTLDQCFPQFLLKTNRRGTHHRIVLAFLLLCISILYITRGQLLQLAGVYTISFLGVMTLFGIGNILLKINRQELKRTYRAGWSTVILGVAATSVGIIGNVILDYKFLIYFALYFIPAVLVVGLMYARIPILKTVLTLINEMLQRAFIWREQVIEAIMDITNIRLVLFIRGGALLRLTKAFDYIQRNESSRTVLVVNLYREHNPAEQEEIIKSLKIMEELFPDLKIEYLPREGQFGPKMVETLSRELKVPKNNMFIGAPEAKHRFSLEDLGGVRVIF
ncbi:MAG: APC family permease [Syntrophales bacterium]|nr:APC family permease [Syntrophales bacterium]MDD5641019.1 APC family permease [Syntrophales bacterium]